MKVDFIWSWFGNNYENFFFHNNMYNRINYNLMEIKLYLLTLLYFFFIMAVYNYFVSLYLSRIPCSTESKS